MNRIASLARLDHTSAFGVTSTMLPFIGESEFHVYLSDRPLVAYTMRLLPAHRVVNVACSGLCAGKTSTQHRRPRPPLRKASRALTCSADARSPHKSHHTIHRFYTGAGETLHHALDAGYRRQRPLASAIYLYSIQTSR